MVTLAMFLGVLRIVIACFVELGNQFVYCATILVILSPRHPCLSNYLPNVCLLDDDRRGSLATVEQQ